MQGAWNDAAIALAPGASEREVIARLDAAARAIRHARRLRPLAPGVASLPLRRDRPGARVRDDRADDLPRRRRVPAQHRALAHRRVATRADRDAEGIRDELARTRAALRADGARAGDRRRAWPARCWASGSREGSPCSTRASTASPTRRSSSHPSVIVVAVGISVAAALVGAISAVRRVLRLPAADAMRAEAPARIPRGNRRTAPPRPVLLPGGPHDAARHRAAAAARPRSRCSGCRSASPS